MKINTKKKAIEKDNLLEKYKKQDPESEVEYTANGDCSDLCCLAACDGCCDGCADVC